MLQKPIQQGQLPAQLTGKGTGCDPVAVQEVLHIMEAGDGLQEPVRLLPQKLCRFPPLGGGVTQQLIQDAGTALPTVTAPAARPKQAVFRAF